MAATKITYDEILKHIGQPGILDHRGITVTTADGKTHKGRRLEVHSDHLTIRRGKLHEDVPASEVARIEIRQAGRFFHHVAKGVALIAALADPTDNEVAIILVPPVLAYKAAASPCFLVADGIAFLIPPKVYEIVH